LDFGSIACDGFSVISKNEIPLITDDRFTKAGIEHGFTTRHGGVSEGNFSSLNLAYSDERSDSLQNVEKNHSMLLEAFDVLPQNAVQTRQLHTDNVVACDNLGGTGYCMPEFSCGVDGVVTCTRGQLLLARMADCLPILMYDSGTGAVAAIHSGWKGTIQSIGAKSADMLCHIHNGRKSDILVSFGPSIGQCCYEVGEEFRRNFINAFGNEVSHAFSLCGKSLYADMREINRIILIRCGIPDKNISVYTPCTCCNENHFFSYRRQKSQRGTLAAVIKCK